MVTEKSQQDNKVCALAKKENEVCLTPPEAFKPSSKPSLQRQKQQLC